MGILDRVNRIVRANVNQILDRAEDPQKSLLLHIEEMRTHSKDARQELVHLSTNEKMARRKYEDCLDESRRWEERAMEALRAGDEDLARRALVYKHQIDSKAEDYLRQAEVHAEYLEQLKSQVVMLDHKVEVAKHRSKEVAGRRARRDAKEAYAHQEARHQPRAIDPEPLEDRRAFEEFDRIDDRISHLDAEMEAMAELNAELFDPRRAEVEQRFRDLEREGRIADSLSDLKRRLDD